MLAVSVNLPYSESCSHATRIPYLILCVMFTYNSSPTLQSLRIVHIHYKSNPTPHSMRIVHIQLESHAPYSACRLHILQIRVSRPILRIVQIQFWPHAPYSACRLHTSRVSRPILCVLFKYNSGPIPHILRSVRIPYSSSHKI